jgi:serine/threonine-protein kinase ATR
LFCFSSIGSFLLPYIILHLIGENLGQDVLDKEIKALISYTNQYDSNEINPSSDVLHQIAQIIFTLIDFLLLFSSLNTTDPNEQAKQLNQGKRQQRQQQQQQQSNQDPLNIQDGTWNNLGITRIRDYIRLLHTDLSLARIAFKYDHYTRAYRHFEMYSSTDQQINISHHSEFLLKLFHRLNDQDSAYGLIAIRDMTPKQLTNPRTDMYEEILSYELTGQIDEAIVAYENVLEINELNQTNIHLYLGYLNNLLTQQQFQHTIDQSTGIIVQYPTWINMLNPLRIEAAWKLSKWNLLEKFCSYEKENFPYQQINETSKMNILQDLNVSKQFEEYVGRILCQAKKQNYEQFYSELRVAFHSLMGPISAASMEVGSYQRAYDYLAKLHLLKDLENFILKNIFHDDESNRIIDNDDIWSQRHALLPPNSQFIEPSLALRRTLLLLDDSKEHALEIGECWLHSARIARAQNNSLAAIGSLMKASQSHPIEVAIERAQWMWDKGEKDRAIMSLKQKKIELLDGRTINETNHIQVSTDLKAQLWLLLARYSEQNSPHEAVFDMYKQAQEAAPHWEETHFYLAQFYDTLLSSCIESDPTSSNSTSTTTTNNFLSSNGLSLENKLRMMEYIRLAVNTYCRSLKYGCEFIYQSLTRLLTMWLDFASDLVPFIKPIQTATSRKQQTLTVAAANLPDAVQIKQHGQAKLSEITREVSAWTTRIPPYLFLAAFPYMVSRICHSEDMTSKALNGIITQVFAAFPQQTLWMMINLYGSSNSMRRDRCIAIWNEAANIEPGLHDFVVEATILIKQLDTLCMHAVTYGQNKISLSAQFKSFKCSYATQSACPILIPIQSQMQVCLPPPPVRFSLSTTSAHVQQQQQQQIMNVDLPADAAAKLTAMANKQGPLGRPTSRKNAQAGSTTNKVPQKTYYDPRHQPFPDAVVTIHSFEDNIEVLSSLQRPKKIVIRGSDGQLYPFLCKSQDDLRVDSRCLDFCHLFNKCLKKNSETRRRQLNIRTYAVYPINERCGLIEWLPNLCTFRSLVTKFYRQRSSNFSEVSNREIKVYGNSKDKTKEARFTVKKIIKKNFFSKFFI